MASRSPFRSRPFPSRPFPPRWARPHPARRRWVAGLALAVAAASGVAAPLPAAAQGEPPVVAVDEIRPVELDAAGVNRPVELAVSGDGRRLYVIDASDRTRAVVTGPAGQPQSTVALPEALRTGELAYDPWVGALAPVIDDGSRLTVGSRSIDRAELGVERVAGVAVDAKTGEVYVGDAARQQVLVLDTSGSVARVLDLSGVLDGNLTDLAVAPSGDQTDGAAVTSLYVLDQQGAVAPALLRELTTGGAATVTSAATAAAPDATATLVRTIAGSSLAPVSPDTSGVSWMPTTGRLLMADSEIDEYNYYGGVNLWQLTTTGGVTDTGTTLAWSHEPTGVSVDPVGNRAFTTDDDTQRVNEIDLGADRRPGTADDVLVRFFSTAAYGNTDPEDVAYDSNRGWLRIADGTNREVYTVNPGANGVFDGGGDDVITHFDTGGAGVADPEGIAYDGTDDTVTMIDYHDTTAVQFSIDGTALRQIDLSASGGIHAAGGTWAPGSGGAARSLWVTDRGSDGSSPVDGKLYELSVPPLGPLAPDVTAPASLAFGPVTVGQQGNATATIANMGAAPLSVSGVSLSGPDQARFTIVAGGGSFTVAPGGAHSVDLRFSPTAEGSASASLTVASNDPDEPASTVALTGSGSSSAAGPISVGGIWQGGSSASPSVATSSSVSVSSGRLYVAYVSSKGFVPVSGVSGLGGTWSSVGWRCGGRNQTGVSVFVTANASSSGPVTVSFGSVPSTAVLAVVEYSGVDLSSPIGAVVGANTNGVGGGCAGGVDSASYSVPVTTVASSSLVTGAVATRNRTNTAGPGLNEALDIFQGSGSSRSGVAVETRPVSGPATVNVSGSLSGTADWAVLAVELRAAGSTGGGGTGSGPVTAGGTWQGSATSSPSVATSSSVSVSSGRLYVAYVSSKGFVPVSGVSGLGGTWSSVGWRCGGRNQTGVSVFVTANASSSGPVTVSFGSVPSTAVLAVVEYSGVDLSSPIGAVVGANTNGVGGGCAGGVDSASYSVPVTTVASSSLVTGAVAIRTRTHLPGAGWAERVELTAGSSSSGAGVAVEDRAVGSPSAITVAGSLSANTDWAVVALELRHG